VQEQLKLTADQKKLVEALQKETDDKLAKILTEDQNKSLKDMRERSGRLSGGPPGPGGPGGIRPGFGSNPFQPGQLLPGFMQDQLKLTAEQKKQVEDLQKDVDAKVKEANDKLAKILTDEQNKSLKEMRERSGRPGGPLGGPGGALPASPGGPPLGFGSGMFPPGQILAAPVQEQLKLTADQKKQVEALQKDTDDKLAKILTDEQNKTLKEMRERFGRPPGPGGPFK
jgi:Spy/CpxP family protein refolding chaperone